MAAMLRVVCRAWSFVGPFALLLGCTHVVAIPAPSSPPDEVAVVIPVELESTTKPEPQVVATEPSEAPPPEPTGDGGHEVRPSAPVAAPGTVPVVEVSQPMVGTTDADVIRRIVRAHINEIRDCYNKGLAKDPTLAGKIVIEFTIGPSGAVERSTATDVSGLADPELPKCIADAIATWTFPAPRGGGRVTVSYPFNLMST